MVSSSRLLPLVLVMPCIGPIVKVASMLSAIATLDLDVIGTENKLLRTSCGDIELLICRCCS